MLVFPMYLATQSCFYEITHPSIYTHSQIQHTHWPKSFLFRYLSSVEGSMAHFNSTHDRVILAFFLNKMEIHWIQRIQRIWKIAEAWIWVNLKMLSVTCVLLLAMW